MELALAPETLARWQFGITTVYHFLFVPLTISLAALTAGLQTAWVRTEKEKYLRATKFWGKLFLINIAMGVVTGIVQEFQFGMNWSDYSRFVGDVFGAPLAFEALIAFFFESTFIGLWIFGWDKLPKRIHLACIWMVSIGTLLSAYFILAANSWMQHPVGYRINEEKGRAELTDFWAVLSQNTTLNQVFHSFSAAFLTGGAFMVGIAAFHLMRKKHIPVMRTSLRLGLVTLAVGGLFTAISGDTLGKVMYEQQPMKMAAAEALWDGEARALLRLRLRRRRQGPQQGRAGDPPGLLSFLAHRRLRVVRARHQRHQRGRPGAVQARRLPAHRARRLLGLPLDDRLRHGVLLARPARSVADPEEVPPAGRRTAPARRRCRTWCC
ncbi:Cytochrome D ubiquinol oxidase, subunit 1 OS=Streptomyces glaucescens OX=1907 GN=SGLAU_16750 PE=3 SV=1 [Streptomyces glaucescens]